MMLGDTSMGMINGYFGPRMLNRHGFTEHKIDQTWIIDSRPSHRCKAQDGRRQRIADRLTVMRDGTRITTLRANEADVDELISRRSSIN